MVISTGAVINRFAHVQFTIQFSYYLRHQSGKLNVFSHQVRCMRRNSDIENIEKNFACDFKLAIGQNLPATVNIFVDSSIWRVIQKLSFLFTIFIE